MPRPRLNPTDEQRHLVKSLAAIGVREQDIARMIGIKSPKTLRHYFREELDRGAVEANSQVARTLFNKAKEGNIVAAIFWMKCRAHWREQGTFEPNSAPPAPFIVSLERGRS